MLQSLYANQAKAEPLDCLLNGGQLARNPVDVGGGLHLLEDLLVLEHGADLCQDIEVLVALTSDTEEQVCLLAVEVDALWVLLQDNAGLLDLVFCLGGTVRNRNAHAHVDTRELVAGDHGVFVACVNAALGDKHLARCADGVLASNGRQTNLDVACGDGQAGLLLGFLLGLLNHCRSGNVVLELVSIAEIGQRIVESVECRVVKEVVDRNDLRAGSALAGTLGKDTLADNDGCIGRNGIDTGVVNLEVGTIVLDAVAEAGSAHCRGAHACIASEDDVATLGRGGESRAVAILGGAAGSGIEHALDAAGIETLTFENEGETRTNTKIVDLVNKTYTDVNEPGAPVNEGLLANALNRTALALQPGDIVVLSGSLPKGAPTDTYADWIRACKGAGARTVLDADGDVMVAGIEAAPFLAKPNEIELGRIVGRELKTDDEIVEAARTLLDKGIEQVMVSMGGAGAIFVSADKTYRIHSPKAEVVSTVGAGDSVVAALVYALDQGKSTEEAIRLSMATGPATVMQPGTKPADPADIERFYDKVEIVEL